MPDQDRAVPSVRIVGAGRAGGAFAGALAGAGWDVTGVLGRADDPSGAARGVDLVLLAVPDGAVAVVAAAITPDPAAVVAHVAGSLGLDVLVPHTRRASIHPLVALPSAALGAGRLAAGAWFAVAGDPLADRLVADLGGRALTVPDEHRAEYHAAACIASNHLVALLAQAARVAEPAGVPLEAYLDLVRATVENVAELGPAAALTGPAARGDEVTLDRHRAALDPSERPAYDAMVDQARRLARDALMRTTTTIAETRALLDAARAAGRTVGLVPTMGYLHEGHASLVRRAADECDVVATTIFVNPLQFGAGEDLDAYPRDPGGDAALAEACGASVLFAPSVEEMYPQKVLTSVSVAGITSRFEGASRPTHFAGVATVVAKLFSIAGPCRAYFGEKDYQQLAVIRRMTADLSMPVEVVGCTTVRAADGLALSSRNAYLTPDERAAAPVLQRALLAGEAAVAAGERDPRAVAELMRAIVDAEPLADLDYAEVVDAATLETVDPLAGELRLLIAARLGRARLIDNTGAVAD